MKKLVQGFTLIELLVTMAIVAIVATMSTIFFLGNISETRDAKRLSDFGTIEKNLDVFFIKRGQYPTPDNGIDITYSGSTVWTQGTFGQGVNKNLGIFGKSFPIDPFYELEYTYSTTNSGREFQIASILENTTDVEGVGELSSVIIPQTYAAKINNAYVRGNYNGFMVRTNYAGKYYYIGTPSIITYDKSDTDIISIIENEKLVFQDFFNIPDGYRSIIENLDGGFSFDVSNPILFSGSIDEVKTEAGLLSFNNNLKFTYSILPIESLDKYEAMTQSEGVFKLKNLLTKYYKIDFKYYLNCFDIKQHGADIDGSTTYKIDPDGPGGDDPYLVYCDMETDGGGWTQVGGNFISNGDFASGSGVVSEWGSNPNNVIVNLGNSNTPVASGYAIHQTSNSGWSNDKKSKSEYEVHFDDADISLGGYQFPSASVQQGYEFRMSLWVRNDDGGGTWVGCTTSPCNHNPYAGYVFHNRLFYTDGTNEVNGTAVVLETQVTSDGKTWEHQRVRKKIRKTPSGFNWYIGYGAELTTDLYFTDVKLELFYK